MPTTLYRQKLCFQRSRQTSLRLPSTSLRSFVFISPRTHALIDYSWSITTHEAAPLSLTTQTAGRTRSLIEPMIHPWSFLSLPIDPISIDLDTPPQLGARQPEEHRPCPLQHETRLPVQPAEPAQSATRPYRSTHLFFSRRGLFRNEDCRAGSCLLYTSDAADERSSVDLGGRRII